MCDKACDKKECDKPKSGPMCGGVGQSKEADADIQHLVDELKSDIKSKAGSDKDHKEFKAVSYASQVVNGINYFIKVHVGDNEHWHVRIHKPLPCHNEKPSVHSVQTGKSKEDAIGHF